MKKLVFGSVLALGAMVSAIAADVAVSAVHDYQSKNEGVRLETTVPFGLTASVTHIRDTANRVAIGKDFALTNVGPVALGASVAGVYQNTDGKAGGVNGYGMTVGAKASYQFNKAVSAVVGVERFIGQDRVDQFNGNLVTAGLNVKF